MNHSVKDDTRQSMEHFSVFRRAAAVLTSSLDLDQALANTISACLPSLGDFGFFDVVLDEGVRRTARAHRDPALEARLNGTRWQRQVRTDINLCALSSGEAVLHNDTDDVWFAKAFAGAPRTLAFRSMLSVPVRYGDELIGSLTLFMGASGRHHDQQHLHVAADLAGLAAPMVVNARLLERQRRTEAALRHSEARLRLAVDAGKIGIWDWDITRDQVLWSERVYELHGLVPGEFGGRVADFADLVHPEDRAEVNQKIQKAVAEGEFFATEFRIRWPNGSVHWLSTWALVHRDGTGRAVRMVGSTIDITPQKNLELGLYQINAQLEQQVETSVSERDRIWRMSQDVLAVASFNGYLQSVSPAFEKILGWSEPEALTIPFMEFIHPDHHGKAQQNLANLAKGQALESYETKMLHKRGHCLWFSWTLVAEGDWFYAVGRDITALRLQRAQLLNATEKSLQLALQVGGMGAWRWDLREGTVTWWPGMDVLHGLPSGTSMADVTDYLQFVHPADHSLVKQSLMRKMPEKDYRIEYRVVWPDGSVHWLEGRGEIFYDENNQPIQRTGICVDITRRKLTEQNLRFLAKASAELAELVDHEETLKKIAQLAVPGFADWCAVDLVDEQQSLKRVAVMHTDPAKVELAHELHRRYPPDPEAPRGAWQVVRSGLPELIPEITDEMLRETIKDDSYLAIIRELGLRSYIGVPLAVRGKTLGVLAFICAESGRLYTAEDASLAEDIGRRASVAIENSMLYRSLKEADRRKDDFLAMLAHELRNPLAPIKVAAELLTLPLSQDRLKDISDIISRQVTHMTGLVNDLLDVSRVTKGQVMIEKLPVDIALIITSAIEQVRPLIEQHQHQLNVDIAEPAIFVEGDEKRLIQVVANLLNNAAKYTPDQGKIDLQIAVTVSEIAIRVTDNGIGMTPDLISSAFELFVQGQRTADRSQGGLGLGLALVKSIIDLHGGSVAAFSKGLGCGSRFVVRLPRLRDSSKVPTRAAQIHTAVHSALNILVVDDNVDAAQTLMTFLQMMGHQVNVSYASESALQQLQQQAFDVVLMDIGLPDMDGNQLAREIHARFAERVPTLIAVTGYGRKEERAAARAAGIHHYYVKPLNTHDLMALLMELKQT